MDFLEAARTCWLEHDCVHLPEDFFQGQLVVALFVRIEFLKLFAEFFLDEYGHFHASVTVEDAKNLDSARQLLSNVGVLLGLAPALHAGGAPTTG